MKIGVECSREDFFYDIHSLVKSFYPDDEVTIFSSDDEARRAASYDCVLKVEIPLYEDKSERPSIKSALKRSLYERLSGETGRTLPWGTLSGIRPTKIPMKALTEGKSADEIRRYMQETYLTSDKKIDLAIEIASREKALIERVKEQEKPASNGVGWDLYAGIPFCPTVCSYCTFSSSPIGRFKDLVDTYIETLIKELTAVSKHFGSRPNTIYIGGGTPTSLNEEQLERLLSAIDRLFSSDKVLEFTVEAGRPDTVTAGKMAVLKSHPVTRVSVNPQTMNDKTLALIGRRHTAAQTVEAFETARKAGFDNINMDLIMGLPDEDLPEVTATLEAVRALGPDSLTVHSLAMKRASHLTLERELYSDRTFRNSEAIMDMAAETAGGMGLKPYYLYRQKNMKGNLENVGYAVPGKECLYNILIMEEIDSIVACGAGASTKAVFPTGRIERVVNPKDVRNYLERIDELIGKKLSDDLWRE